MPEIVADSGAIAFCGLYCGACKRYLAGKCPGCAGNDKASWCKIRSCGLEAGIKSCADCQQVSDLAECKKLNNLMAKFFALIFRSNRQACLEYIRERGYEAYAVEMAREGRQSLPR